MNKRIVYQNGSGVSVVIPSEGARLALGVLFAQESISSNIPVRVDSFLGRWPVDGVKAEWAETEDEFLLRMMERLAVNGQVVSTEELPQDRSFRNAWVLDGSAVSVDMYKAREIHRNTLRAARAPKLQDLDVAYLRALEAGNKEAQTGIAAEKQVLRDVTEDPAIDAARTPQELKAILPESLR